MLTLIKQVELAIGEAVFSRTYKCVDTSTNAIVCLKIIKNNKEYFDQGVDEIRLLQFIARNCNVDDKHLVRLLDYFYFREHLIIVTEVRLTLLSCLDVCLYLLLELTHMCIVVAGSFSATICTSSPSC